VATVLLLQTRGRLTAAELMHPPCPKVLRR